ncbi:PilI type IV pilus biogenesis protein [Haloferax larsenii]|uniref:PilI type IV pilus biogenesis protein n=1 Tax=Haloferax larsenii TaxID=302484 RepID=A0ABY5RDH6_HALLR|nr:PilI type IV pilus biogenesis protein [Haloferax larsenii]
MADVDVIRRVVEVRCGLVLVVHHVRVVRRGSRPVEGTLCRWREVVVGNDV